MFRINDKQIKQMALPLIKKLIDKAVVSLRTDYPYIYDKKNNDELIEQLSLLMNDIEKLHFEQDETIIAYLIVCVRYRTNYQRLINNSRINSIICNQGFYESEKVYLIDEILHSL